MSNHSADILSFTRRKITDRLNEWLESGRSTCPIVLGGRKVGKTYIVDGFLRSRFGSYLRIDFSVNAEARAAFDGSLDANAALNILAAGRTVLAPSHRLRE